MNNDDDIKKVEKYLENKKEQNYSKYKVDLLDELEKKKQYETSPKHKAFQSFFKLSKNSILLVVFIVIVLVGIFACYKLSNLASKSNVNIEEKIEGYLDESIKCIYQDTENNGNGIYIFCLQSNSDIQIYAVKRYGRYEEDTVARCLKYYFEQWEDEYKEKFIINEEYTRKHIIS